MKAALNVNQSDIILESISIVCLMRSDSFCSSNQVLSAWWIQIVGNEGHLQRKLEEKPGHKIYNGHCGWGEVTFSGFKVAPLWTTQCAAVKINLEWMRVPPHRERFASIRTYPPNGNRFTDSFGAKALFSPVHWIRPVRSSCQRQIVKSNNSQERSPIVHPYCCLQHICY